MLHDFSSYYDDLHRRDGQIRLMIQRGYDTAEELLFSPKASSELPAPNDCLLILILALLRLLAVRRRIVRRPNKIQRCLLQ